MALLLRTRGGDGGGGAVRRGLLLLQGVTGLETQQLALSRVHTASDGAPSGLASSSGALPSVDMRAARSVVTAAGGDGDDRAMSALRASTSYGASAGVTGSMALPFRPQQRSGQYFVPGSEGERALARLERRWWEPPPKPQRPAPRYEPDWPPGREEALHQAAAAAGLPPVTAAVVVGAAFDGVAPDEPGLLERRVRGLLGLQHSFPGLDAKQAMVSEPRLLALSRGRVRAAMAEFQDRYPQKYVGHLMPRLGYFIVQDPSAVAAALQALPSAYLQHVGVPFPLEALGPASSFLTLPPAELHERTAAAVTILGRPAAAIVLVKDPSTVLGLLPQQLNDVALRLRDGVGRSDGPLGLAGGTANPQVRQFVSDLVAAEPSLLSRRRWDSGAVAATLAALAEATGLAGEGLRDLLLRAPGLLKLGAVRVWRSSEALGRELGGAEEARARLAAEPELLLAGSAGAAEGAAEGQRQLGGAGASSGGGSSSS